MGVNHSGLGEITRVLGNFWTAVFDRPITKRNSPIRDVITLADMVEIAEVDIAEVDWNFPTPRYYQALTQTGTDQDGGEASAWGANATNYMQMPTQWLDPESVWFVLKIKVGWAAASPPAGGATFLHWYTDATHEIRIWFDDSDGKWKLERHAVSAGIAHTSHAANAILTVIGRCTAAGVGISINGSAFVTAAEVTGNAIAGDLRIGSYFAGATAGANSSFHWVVIGEGTMSDAQAALYHALASTDPTWETLPDFYTCLPAFLWPGVDNAHEPSARYGETEYP